MVSSSTGGELGKISIILLCFIDPRWGSFVVFAFNRPVTGRLFKFSHIVAKSYE